MSKEVTGINSELLVWCFIVLLELFILAWLINTGLVLVFGLLLIFPVLAAFNWPCVEQIEEKTLVSGAKAEEVEK